MLVNSVICYRSNNCCIVINQVKQPLYLLQLWHHPLRTKDSLNKTTCIFVPFFFFCWLSRFVWSFGFLLNFSFDPCLVAKKWRGSRRNVKVWIFSVVFLFWVWNYMTRTFNWIRKKSNLIFFYYFCAESELYIRIINWSNVLW